MTFGTALDEAAAAVRAEETPARRLAAAAETKLALFQKLWHDSPAHAAELLGEGNTVSAALLADYNAAMCELLAGAVAENGLRTDPADRRLRRGVTLTVQGPASTRTTTRSKRDHRRTHHRNVFGHRPGHRAALARRPELTVYATARRTEAVARLADAGYGTYGTVEETDSNEVRRQFETNVFGLARMTQLVMPAMRDAGAHLAHPRCARVRRLPEDAVPERGMNDPGRIRRGGGRHSPAPSTMDHGRQPSQPL